MKIKNLIMLSFSMCILIACEDIYEGGENRLQTEVAVSFKSAITPYDKDYAEVWKGGESVGVYMIKNKADFTAENCINNVFNKKITAQTDGILTVPESETFLYPTDDTKVDFVLYTPWQSDIADNCLKLDVTNREKSESSDYLYSNNAKNKYRTTSPVRAVFKHLLSKMILRITNGEGISAEELKSMKITCTNLPATGKFSLGLAELVETGEPNDIAISVSEEGTYAECALLPVTGNGLLQFEMTNNQYNKKMGTLTFEMGKQYIFDAVVSLSGIEIALKEIEDWEVEVFEE